jgi:hypothetical protein
MALLDNIERKFSWLAFPGLLRNLTILCLLVYGIAWTKPEFGDLIDFDRAKILNGQWWRLISFPFAPYGAGRPSLISIIFVACMVRFSMTISDTLEQAWGEVRTTLFILVAILGQLVAGFVAPATLPFSGAFIFGSAFLAFARLCPNYPMLFMLIIPVPCKYLAYLQCGMLALISLTLPSMIPFILLCHLNLLIWVVPGLWRETKLQRKAITNRRSFQAKVRPRGEAFHTCVTCGKSEHDGAHLEFRVGADGEEYCVEHLPK